MGVFAAVLVGPTPAASQVHRLSDPGDRLLVLGHRFVEARNSSDANQRVELLNGLMAGSSSPKTGVSDFLGDLLRLGGKFEPHAFYSVGGGAAIHIVGRESGTGDWTRYQLGIDEGRPDRIGLIAQTESREPVSLPRGNLSREQAGDLITSYAARLARESQFSGALLIVQQGKVLVEAYLGAANDETGAAVGPGTPMNMASGSKMFTAILVGKAVEEGRLHWEDTVAQLVPILRQAQWSRHVTVRQLLTHSSGLAEYWDEEFEAASGRVSNLEDFVPYFVDKKPEFDPGERSAYSNTNFIVLGLVLEALNGRTYAEQVRAEILEPMGMRTTSLARSAGAAVAYEIEMPGAWGPVTLDLPPSSAGGAVSTLNDLLAFAEAVRHHRLVSPATLAHMTARHTQLGGGVAYGLGFEVAPDGAYWGHGGRGPGVTFDFRVYPETDMVLVAMSNRDSSGYLDLLLTVDEVLARLDRGTSPQRNSGFEILGHSFIAVQVRDVDEAARWYADVLGLRPLKRLDDDQGRFAIRLLARGGLVVELIDMPTTVEAPEPRVFGLFKAGFYVDDVDAAHARMVRHGVDADEQVFTDETLAARSFLLRDPEGNRLQVFQAVSQ